MSRKRFSTEQIIIKLREAEVLSSKGMKVGDICRQLGVTENTYYRWRKEYGGLELDQARSEPPRFFRRLGSVTQATVA